MSSAEPSLNLPDASQLTVIAERAVRMTAAAGAMIALKQDDGLITLASSGQSVPKAGTPVRPTSFAGRCVLEQSLLICPDTDTDPRVDAAACRAVNVRSMMAAPVVSDGGIAGVLAVFASHPKAFSEDSAARMRALALNVGELIVPGEDLATAAPAESPVLCPEAEPEVRILPVSEEREKVVEPATVETMLPVPEIAALPPAPTTELPVDITSVPLHSGVALEQMPEPIFLSGFGQEEAPANRRWGLKLAIALLAVFALAAGQWMFRGRIVKAIRSRFAAHAAASVQPVAPAPTSAEPVVRPAPALASPAADQTVTSEVMPAKAATAPVSDPAAKSLRPQQNERLTTAASSAANRGKEVANAAPAEVRPPQLLSRVEPVSPPGLKAESIVALNAAVMKDGSIGKVTVVSGEPALRQVAIAAVKRWRYRPAYQNGQPVAVTVPVEITFGAAH